MSYITKKQSSLTLIAVVLAIAMIVGTISSSVNMIFAITIQNATGSQSVTCDTHGGQGETGGAGGAIPAGACSNINIDRDLDTGDDIQ